MAKEGNGKPDDFEKRTFAKRVRAFLKRVPRSDDNVIDGRQLLRCSGSIGANYIEANEGLSKKDSRFRLRISRKEAKESRFFLRLLEPRDSPRRNGKR
ncbi:MAG TPA: four helix bundle protein [Tepidisphaeraceae bacterium]|nr:four helix bundle protein [Tepidisphaeraceae bacterium]